MSITLALTLEQKALSIATGQILSECEGSWLDGFNALVDSKGDFIPAHISVHQNYEHCSAWELLEEIKEIHRLILDSSTTLFELAKSSIVHQTLECTIDGDMNNLDFQTLVAHGLALELEG
jgi:hypothetical protein